MGFAQGSDNFVRRSFSAGERRLDRALFAVGIRGFPGKEQGIGNRPGELLRHFGHAHGSETISSATQRILAPVVKMTRG